MSEPYLDAVKRALPRLLGMFDADPTSASYGCGDRYRWAWKLIDFGNGTYQGAAHGLARLWAAGRWPYPTPEAAFLARIDAIFEGARRLTRGDGSLEEAFPHEGSFCVTALVAFDLLAAAELLDARLEDAQRTRWRAIVEPMIGFLMKADETHAFISNHLATAVAALARWGASTAAHDAEQRACFFLRRILDAQSPEGWFPEYGGFDAGYQSLCIVFLADVHRRRPDWALGEPLARSIRFLWQFANPDGSFGGLYGSRSTRFYFPAGVEALVDEMPEAAALAERMARSVADRQVVGLDSIDDPNLVPMFNAYCWADALRQARPPAMQRPPTLPAEDGRPMRIHHPEAGIWIDAGPRHRTIVSTHKGGVVSHFVDGRQAVVEGGVVVRGPGSRLGSTQGFDRGNEARVEGNELCVESRVRPMAKRLPSPAQFLLLRVLCATVFNVRAWRELAKRALVRMLITRDDSWPLRNRRRIRFGEDLAIVDETTQARGYERLDRIGAFVAIHMASQGYWQVQDEGSRP
ncbi:MAG TPA: hypothetical protein VMU47_00365 [Caldimonas sp.]|nr:hypothetical protein [Caldimonas sp.]